MNFLLATLALWRVTHLIAKEDGPWDVIYHIRKTAGTGFFGSLLDCFYCVSIWTAIPFGCWLGNNWWEKVLYWLALSGAACLLERATGNKNNSNNTLPYYKED